MGFYLASKQARPQGGWSSTSFQMSTRELLYDSEFGTSAEDTTGGDLGG